MDKVLDRLDAALNALEADPTPERLVDAWRICDAAAEALLARGTLPATDADQTLYLRLNAAGVISFKLYMRLAPAPEREAELAKLDAEQQAKEARRRGRKSRPMRAFAERVRAAAKPAPPPPPKLYGRPWPLSAAATHVLWVIEHAMGSRIVTLGLRELIFAGVWELDGERLSRGPEPVPDRAPLPMLNDWLEADEPVAGWTLDLVRIDLRDHGPGLAGACRSAIEHDLYTRGWLRTEVGGTFRSRMYSVRTDLGEEQKRRSVAREDALVAALEKGDDDEAARLATLVGAAILLLGPEPLEQLTAARMGGDGVSPDLRWAGWEQADFSLDLDFGGVFGGGGDGGGGGGGGGDGGGGGGG